jgi:hypothetical protein
MAINLNFNDETYNNGNKPNTTTLKGDLNTIETQVNSNITNISTNTSAIAQNTTHRGLSSGVHGATGSIVGTTDSQTLSSKTYYGGFALEDGHGANYQISTSIATDDLTVSLQSIAGNTPSTGTDELTFRIGNTIISRTSALSVELLDSDGDVFDWDSGKVQGNDAFLFVYVGLNGSTLRLGVSPDPSKKTAGSNRYYGNSQEAGSAGHTNAVWSGTMDATDECRVIGRIRVNQADDDDWESPSTSETINYPIFETDWVSWTPSYTGSGSMTYTSVTTDAKYKYRYDACEIVHNSNGTVGGTPATDINVTLPTYNTNTDIIQGWGVTNDNSTNRTGQYPLINATNSLICRKTDFSNYTAGTVIIRNSILFKIN